MKVTWAFLAVSAAMSVLAMDSRCRAVDTSAIERVRNKEVLDDEDRQIIDGFVASVVDELLNNEDFTAVATVRREMVSRKSSNRESAQAQYTAKFFESAQKYVSQALTKATNFNPEGRRFKVMLNLLILIDNLQDLRMTDLALRHLKDENKAVRYWAVHAVTNAAIVKQLNSGETDNVELAKNITKQLKQMVGQAFPEIVALIAEFAAKVDIPQGEELLLQIADMRMKKYTAWSMDYELLDATVLKMLYEKISDGGSNKAFLGQSFGQLYSYAIQRYINGQDFLADAQKQSMVSILVEVETHCIRKILGNQQNTIKKAVEQGNLTTLLEEHDRLLGNSTNAGQVSLKLNFDYGTDPNGRKRTAPLVLPKPPETERLD